MARDKMNQRWTKSLDTKLKNVYNNRVAKGLVEKQRKAFETKWKALPPVNNELHSTNIEETRRVDGEIRRLALAIKETIDVEYPTRRSPIIAGGAIRDCVFGLTPRDYDIFLDVSDLPDDEKDDYVLMFADSVLKRLGQEREELVNLPFEEGKYSNGESTLQSFVVYTAQLPAGAVPGGFADVAEAADERDPWGDIWADQPAQPADQRPGGLDVQVGDRFEFNGGRFRVAAVNVAQGNNAVPGGLEGARVDAPRRIAAQFIGHNDDRLTGGPIAFLDYFDYPLVKAMFDPDTMEYVYTEAFTEVLDSKKMPLENKKAYTRAIGWINRFYPNRPVNITYIPKVENKVPWPVMNAVGSTGNQAYSNTNWVTYPR